LIEKRLSDSLDYYVVRAAGCIKESCTVLISGHRKDRYHTARVYKKVNRYYYDYKVDLLDVLTQSPYVELEDKGRHFVLSNKCLHFAKKQDPKTWCDRLEWRELTSFTVRPDSVVQLGDLYDTDLAGTVNLFPKTGVGYNTKVPGRHAGEHYHEKDAFVGFYGVPIRGSERLGAIENGAIAPTIYEFITGRPADPDKGWGFPSEWSKLKGK
jgi:hypothetical protein